MRETLEKLYNGEIVPREIPFEENEHYQKVLKALADSEEKLKGLLKGEERKLFDQYLDAVDEMQEIANKEYFIYGFRLASRLLFELFSKQDGAFYGLT